MSEKRNKNAQLPHFPITEGKKELIEQTNKLSTEPPFVRVYLETLTSLSEKNEKKTKLLFYLLENMNSIDNKISLDPSARNTLLDTLNLKQSLYYKHMKEFTAHGYITRCAKCIYMLNPHLFFRGFWGNQAKKARIEYIDLRLKYDKKTEKNILTAKPVKAKKRKKPSIKVESTQEETNQEEINTQLTNNTNIKHLATIEYYINHLEAVTAFRQMCFDYDDTFFTLQQNIETFDNWCEMFKLDKQGNPRMYPAAKIKCNNYFKRCLETHNNSIQNEVQTNKDLMNADLLGDFL